MKITEIEGYETLATKADLKDLRKELQMDIRELRVEVKEQFQRMKDEFQRIKILIWLPVIAAVAQILLAIFKH